MQIDATTAKEMGILAAESYKSFEQYDIIQDDELITTYTVVETQNTVLFPLYTNYEGFQAQLLKDTAGNYVIAFRSKGVKSAFDFSYVLLLGPCAWLMRALRQEFF